MENKASLKDAVKKVRKHITDPVWNFNQTNLLPTVTENKPIVKHKVSDASNKTDSKERTISHSSKVKPSYTNRYKYVVVKFYWILAIELTLRQFQSIQKYLHLVKKLLTLQNLNMGSKWLKQIW